MTFTYLGTLATDVDKVRFYTGDTSNAPDVGIKPGGVNFTDEELSGLVTAEGKWQRAVAAVYEALAALFAQEVDEREGEKSTSYSQKAKQYAALAKEWRTQHGHSTSGVLVYAMTRVDGYSDDIPADEV